VTDPAGRTTAPGLGIAAILLGGILLGSSACGSVTARKTDGGGAGGSHGDASMKTDVAADLRARDALENHDSSSAKDMRTAGGSGGGGAGAGGGGVGAGSGGVGAGSGGAGAGGGGSGGRGGASGGSGAAGSGSGGTGAGSGGVGGAGECQTNADCTLYMGAGNGCCGVCQPATDPAPPPIECLLACSSLLTVKTCGCVNNQCVGKTTQL